MLKKLRSAVELDPALLDERLRLTDCYFVVGRIDAQQDLAGPEHAARYELGRNFDNGPRNLRAEHRLRPRQHRSLAAYRELGRQRIQPHDIDEQRTIIDVAFRRLLPKPLGEAKGDGDREYQNYCAQTNAFGFCRHENPSDSEPVL